MASCAHFKRAASPVLVDPKEDVAYMMDRLTSLQLLGITLPEMSLEAL